MNGREFILISPFSGFWFRVSGFWFRVSGFWFRVSREALPGSVGFAEKRFAQFQKI